MLKTVSPQKVAAQLRGEQGGTVGLSESVDGNKTDTAAVTALLLDLCVCEQKTRTRNYKQARYVWLPAWAGFVVGVCWVFHHFFMLPGSPAFITLQALMPIVFVYLLNAGQRPAQGLQTNAAKSLTIVAPGDIRVVATLIDLLPLLPSYSPIPLNALAEELTGLLPAMAPSIWNADDELLLTLNETRRARLRSMLNALWKQEYGLTEDETDFCIAAIKVLVLVGDSPSGKLLQRIAKATTYGENRAFVQSFANDCLPIFRERTMRKKSTDAQLRKRLKLGMTSKEVVETEAFLDALHGAEGESAVLRVIHRLRRRDNVVLVVAMASACSLMWLFFCSPDEKLLIGIAWIFVVFGGSKLPDLCSGLAASITALKGNPSQWLSQPNTTESVVFHWLARRNEKRLLSVLLQLLEDSSTFNPQQIARQLDRLEPGDGVYLTSQNLAFLRRIVARRVSQGAKACYGTDLTAAAIHVLGIAGDASVRVLLSCIVESSDPLLAPFRPKALKALSRIDDLTEWRAELKPIPPASRRRNPVSSTRT